MITTKNFTSSVGDTVTVKYPTGTIFMRERNYLTVSSEADDYYLKKITLAGKTISFGRYCLQGSPMTLDVTPYYAKFYTSGTISLVVETSEGKDETFTVSFTIDKVEGYSPFFEFVPERCVDAPYARIVPPYRMLWDGNKKSTSLLAAVRDSDRFSGYEYEMDGVPYATYRPSDKWLTNAQKNEHLGETYRNTLKASGNLEELDSNGNPMWIEQGILLLSTDNQGKTFEELRFPNSSYCRTKTIFKTYNGLTIGATPNGILKIVMLYNANKKYIVNYGWETGSRTLNTQYPYFSLGFKKTDGTNITPSELVGITSSALTNPEAGKSYRWAIENNKYKWVELTAEQLINERFFWSINGKNDASEVLNKQFEFGKSINANLVFQKDLSPLVPPKPIPKFEVLQSVKRSVSLADSSLPYVYIRWKMPWGITVEHLFYLGTYSSDKADAKELESLNYYEELSNHVRVGSFYLDGIVQPYDLFYYKTLENAELVEMYFPPYAFKPSTYMPNGDDYVAIKIKSSDVAEAVVDGVAQRVITFKFELS